MTLQLSDLRTVHSRGQISMFICFLSLWSYLGESSDPSLDLFSEVKPELSTAASVGGIFEPDAVCLNSSHGLCKCTADAAFQTLVIEIFQTGVERHGPWKAHPFPVAVTDSLQAVKQMNWCIITVFFMIEMGFGAPGMVWAAHVK